MNNQKVTIDIDEQDAERYKLFCQHYEKVKLMIDRGVFDIKGGSILINVDQNGVWQTIAKNEILYTHPRRLTSVAS